jgi:2-polyprenyl-3-methyl-5-hydroxy-6-metoxy-1,4-benzoquinol methylase
VIAEAEKVADKVCGKDDITGQFDTILVFDALDHLQDESEIVEAMRTIKEVSHPGTTIHIRCHPWTSRHATHAYYSFNKAYAHIFLDDLGVHTVKMTTPIKFYEDMFSEFKVLKVKRHVQAIEPIFRTPELVEAFQRELNGDMNWQYHVLPIQFVDFKLQLC